MRLSSLRARARPCALVPRSQAAAIPWIHAATITSCHHHPRRDGVPPPSPAESIRHRCRGTEAARSHQLLAAEATRGCQPRIQSPCPSEEPTQGRAQGMHVAAGRRTGQQGLQDQDDTEMGRPPGHCSDLLLLERYEAT